MGSNLGVDCNLWPIHISICVCVCVIRLEAECKITIDTWQSVTPIPINSIEHNVNPKLLLNLAIPKP